MYHHDFSGVAMTIEPQDSLIIDYRSVLKIHYDELSRFLTAYLAKSFPNSHTITYQALATLTITQLHAYSTDVYDEVMRRKNEREVPYLPASYCFHPMRNKMRREFATYSTSHFQGFSSDLYHELSRRYPEFERDVNNFVFQDGAERPHRSGPYSTKQSYEVVDLSGKIIRGKFVAAGGSGQIYKGGWIGDVRQTGQEAIAVKVISVPALSHEGQKDKRYKRIKHELVLWSKINHENILPLLGVACIDGDSNIPAFVCPWMENGNAKEFCSRNPLFPRSSILYGIINGLHYLHTFEPEIVHGDIKAANVLINDQNEACLCDFGLSRFVADNTLWKTTATHASGTLRWMAPELLDGEVCTPTKASDIYAYGMTCYEILSGNVPFKSTSNEFAIMRKVMNKERPERMESYQLDVFWNIITQCWVQEPKKRPSTVDLFDLVEPAVLATGGTITDTTNAYTIPYNPEPLGGATTATSGRNTSKGKRKVVILAPHDRATSKQNHHHGNDDYDTDSSLDSVTKRNTQLNSRYSHTIGK